MCIRDRAMEVRLRPGDWLELYLDHLPHAIHAYRVFVDRSIRHCAERTTELHSMKLAFIGLQPGQRTQTRARRSVHLLSVCLSIYKLQ